MTFDEIVDRVASRLNLTNGVTLLRIGNSVNERYGRLSAAVGLSNVTRTQTPIIANTVIGSALVTFTGIERIYTVMDPTNTPARILDEVTENDIRLMPAGTDPPRAFAIIQTGAGSVKIRMNCTAATVYPLWADGDADASTLSGTAIPAFPAKFHDILVYGAMANELEHMEKYEMAARQETRWEQMLSQLRLYLASSAYLDMYQGKNSPSDFPTWCG